MAKTFNNLSKEFKSLIENEISRLYPNKFDSDPYLKDNKVRIILLFERFRDGNHLNYLTGSLKYQVNYFKENGDLKSVTYYTLDKVKEFLKKYEDEIEAISINYEIS